jgi:hypothetical protein
MAEKIMDLIREYAKKHELAMDCGSEYIYQDDVAQTDAIKLVAEIFDVFVEES